MASLTACLLHRTALVFRNRPLKCLLYNLPLYGFMASWLHMKARFFQISWLLSPSYFNARSVSSAWFRMAFRVRETPPGFPLALAAAYPWP